jgi:hypothetical protein
MGFSLSSIDISSGQARPITSKLWSEFQVRPLSRQVAVTRAHSNARVPGFAVDLRGASLGGNY